MGNAPQNDPPKHLFSRLLFGAGLGLILLGGAELWWAGKLSQTAYHDRAGAMAESRDEPHPMEGADDPWIWVVFAGGCLLGWGCVKK